VRFSKYENNDENVHLNLFHAGTIMLFNFLFMKSSITSDQKVSDRLPISNSESLFHPFAFNFVISHFRFCTIQNFTAEFQTLSNLGNF
jgi:hypothetical protein